MAHTRLTDYAKQLRVEQTEVERFLWGRLRDRRLGGWKWKRQVPRGYYIADFLSLEAGVVVELDGGQHVDNAGYDARRTAYLERQGLVVLRFWNPEVRENLDGVCDAILAACGGERPSP